MNSVLSASRTTKRNFTVIGYERDLCDFVGSFVGKGVSFPPQTNSTVFAIRVFPVFEAPITQFNPHVRLMADSTPSFLIAEI